MLQNSYHLERHWLLSLRGGGSKAENFPRIPNKDFIVH